MSEVMLNATARETTGKKSAKSIRREGKVPAIYYGHNEKNILLTVDKRELVGIISSETGLFDLKIDKQKAKKVILREIQFDPITNSPVHVDIMGVKMKEKIHLSVPVHIIGEAIGVKRDGGVLNQVLHEIEVSCLPLDLPEHIDVDVSDLTIGDSIHISDITMENVELLNEADNVIVSVIASRATKEAAETEEVAEAEEVAESEEE
ncbi:50S ribosomal protein L25/general stress protein Ctc [candidate division KSB1 bacterium]|nr:50S ribosomal protein L25/general stress protein Ctc [candidate division KSB1 bacterium]